MKPQHKSASDLKFTELKLDKIIKECQETKKELTGNFVKINKQLYSQRSGWKHMESYLKSHKNVKSAVGLGVTNDIHKKFREICDKQLDSRTRKMSKFLIRTNNESITDKELIDNETLKFFLANKRGFGSPVKKILYSPQKKDKVRSCDISINPEETILKDIFAIKASHLSHKKSLFTKRKKLKKSPHERKPHAEENEPKLLKLNTKNKLILKEMKKIEPINLNLFTKRDNKLFSSMSKHQKASSVSRLN